MNSRLDYALSLAQEGFRIHPLRPGQKIPLLEGWQRKATTNPDTINSWFQDTPDCNIGLYTNNKRGYVVVDVDPKNGGLPVFTTLQESLDFPDTWTVTTPSGGFHLYYWVPHTSTVMKEVIGVAPGVDLLYNRNVVAPGSETPKGSYKVSQELPIAEAPEWLIDTLSLVRDYLTLPEEQVEGGRNDALNRHGFTVRNRLFRAGVDNPEAVKAVMLFSNLNSCDPPLKTWEVLRTWESVISASIEVQLIMDPREASTLPLEHVMETAPRTDEGNLARLVRVSENRLRHWADKSNAVWWWFNGVHWEAQDRAIIQYYANKIAHHLEAIAEDKIQAAGTDPEAQRIAQRFKDWASQLRNVPAVNRLVTRAEGAVELRVDVTDFDPDPYLLGVTNGVLDLTWGDPLFNPTPEPDLMVSKTTGVAYDPEAKAPLWEKFINEIMSGDVAMVQYLQRVLGYSLTGSTREQALFLCVGSGANGKSVMLNAFNRLMGDYGETAVFSTFDADNSSSSIPSDLAILRGVRFVYSTEREDERKLAEGRIKLVTGGDFIKARFLYGNWFTYLPEFKVFLAVNTLPRIVGTDEGIWRRLQVIDFRESFIGREDKDLPEKLEGELPGILNWALEGLRDYQEQGLNPPERVLLNVSNYRTEMDTLQEFIEEATEVQPGVTVHTAEMYNRYRDWSKANGHYPMSKTRFTRTLSGKGYQKRRVGGKWHWEDLALTEAEDIFTQTDTSGVHLDPAIWKNKPEATIQ